MRDKGDPRFAHNDNWGDYSWYNKMGCFADARCPILFYSEVMCIFVLYLVEYRLFACFSLLEWICRKNNIGVV